MSAVKQAVVTVNATGTRPLSHIWTFVGYDEPNYTYTARGRELLAKLGTMADAPYAVRCHFLLCSGDGTPSLKWGSSDIYTEDENGLPVYSWEIIDRIFDTYVETGCIPFVEIGFMPQALSAAPADVQYATPEGGGGWSYPPTDYNRWDDLVATLAGHLRERYGLGEVHRWYWELWNEPDIGYWSGSIEEFCALYDHTEAALHSVIPGAYLGGPATTNPGRENAGDFLRAFLSHCVNGRNAQSGQIGTRLDFISFHSKGGLYKTDSVDTKHTPTIESLIGHIRRGLAIASEFPELAGRAVHISECDPDGWAAGTIRDNPNLEYRNSEYYASYIAMSACQIVPLSGPGGHPVGPVNPVHSMLTWAFEFENRDFFEGFRTLSTNGIDKPSLNALRLLGRLGRTGIAADSSSPVLGVIAGSDDAEGLTLLLCAHHDDWDEYGRIQVDLKTIGLPTGRTYRITTTRIDHTHGNSYTEWKRLGEPQSPSEEQLTRIRAAAALRSEEAGTVVVDSDGAATVRLALESHAVCLVEMRALETG